MSVRPRPSVRSRRPSPDRALVAACERLEPRALLSLTPAGVEFRLNTLTASSQSNPAAAMDGDGEFVIAWQSAAQDGSGSGIYLKRHNFGNNEFPIGEIAVNTFTTGNQTNPAIAIDAEDEFIVVWQSAGQDGSGEGVYAQRYARVGGRRGNEFRVNEVTAGDQGSPAVASAATGDFVVAWQSPVADGSGFGVVARLYDLHGIPRGAEFRVNTFTTDNQLFPAVAMDADGDFVVAWTSYAQDGGFNGVYAQRFDKTGAAQGVEFRVNAFTTNDQDFPAVAMDHSGDFVIAWESSGQDGSGDGVYAQRYDAAGAAQGGEFRVNVTTSSQQGAPGVTIDADGEFVVTWASSAGGTGNDVFVRQYDAAGAAQTGELRANTFTSFNQSFPTVAVEHEGDLVVAWQGDGQDGSGYGVYAQRYDQGADDAGPVVSDVTSHFERFIPGVRLARNILSIGMEFSEAMSEASGATGPNSVTNPANYAMTRNGVDYLVNMDVSYTSSLSTYRVFLTDTQFLLDGDYVVTVRGALQDLAGNALDGDRDGVPGGDYSFAFTVEAPVKLDPEFRVNSTTSGNQSDAAVATDDAGNFVVAWSAPDGGGGSLDSGIFAQRFSAGGTPIGGEFRVNTFSTGTQRLPAVAMDVDGDFVVAWQSYGQDGSSYGVYAQRYDASGAAQGVEFRINQHTTSAQTDPTIAMTRDGAFVVAWDSLFQGFPDGAVVARRYGAGGAPLGNEFIAGDVTFGNEQDPSIATDFDGDFVIAWSGPGDSGSDSDVYVRRYNRDGAAVGREFIVNTFFTGEQFSPAVAMQDDGDFTVAWTNRSEDGLNDDVHYRRVSAAGVGTTVQRANTFTTGRQWFPAVALDGDGDFVITWASDAQDGSGFGVYGLFGFQFNEETRFSTFSPGDQHYPAVAMDADGDFVVAWHSAGQDGAGDGIFAQRFATAPLRVTASNFQFLTAPHRLSFSFNQPVQTLLLTFAMRLENLTTGFSFGAPDGAYDPDTNTVTFTVPDTAGSPGRILSDGRYRATLLADRVLTLGGTPLPQDHVFEFFFLHGDANRDARVNLDDFNILAANFGQSGRDFSQGDFTYDGIVNLNDFNVLASRFGATVAPANSSSGPFTRSRIGDADTDDPDDELLA